jgi:tyrosine-specific transport protein
MKREVAPIQAIATMIGTIIGAGILGIPFVFAQSGFLTGLVVLVFLSLLMCSLKLMFGEITLRTYGRHQLSGYVEKYLGSFFKRLVSVVLIITISGSLLAYFVGIGNIMTDLMGGDSFLWGLGFYFLLVLLLFFGINLIKKIELYLTLVIFLAVLLIILFSSSFLSIENVSYFDFKNLFIPYGVILFALSGLVAVPEVREIMTRREHKMKEVLVVGSLTPAFIYFIFALVVVGVTGPATTEVATIGLGHVLGKHVFLIGSFFALIAMITSFLSMGVGLKDTYQFDFKINNILSWLLVAIVPLFLYTLGLKDFIEILAFIGAIGYGINGLVYLATFWVARSKGIRKPEYEVPKILAIFLTVILTFVFLAGLVYTIFGML